MKIAVDLRFTASLLGAVQNYCASKYYSAYDLSSPKRWGSISYGDDLGPGCGSTFVVGIEPDLADIEPGRHNLTDVVDAVPGYGGAAA